MQWLQKAKTSFWAPLLPTGSFGFSPLACTEPQQQKKAYGHCATPSFILSQSFIHLVRPYVPPGELLESLRKVGLTADLQKCHHFSLRSSHNYRWNVERTELLQHNCFRQRTYKQQQSGTCIALSAEMLLILTKERRESDRIYLYMMTTGLPLYLLSSSLQKDNLLLADTSSMVQPLITCLHWFYWTFHFMCCTVINCTLFHLAPWRSAQSWHLF